MFKNVLTIFLITLVSAFACAQKTKEELLWKGFKRINYEFENRDVRIIVPIKAAHGNPWVWRARFPEYHAEIDSALVADGFHVAYINTDNMFGSPEAVEVRNRFYDFIVNTHQLRKKVALHGHSRGGLFTYNWAKTNAEKVACIYVDAPVCDFKSWPAGFGEGDGSARDWKVLKEAYGFKSDEEAKKYSNNPINNLEALVNSKVPILHTISLNDKVVPPKENSIFLANNYISLGGMATVYPCVEGIQKSKGHHYSIDNSKVVLEFIKQHSVSK